MRFVDISFKIDLKGHAGLTLFAINNVFLDADQLEELFDNTPDPNIIEGTLFGVGTLDDTIIVRAQSVGIPFRSWFVTLELNGKEFPDKPIEFRIKANGRFNGASESIDLP